MALKSKTLEAAIVETVQVHDDFLATGVLKLTHASREESPMRALTTGNIFRSFMRQVAKEKRRFFIVAEMHYGGGVKLTVPRSRRLQTVVASLLVVARELENGRLEGHPPEGVGVVPYEHSKSMWQFFFTGEVGQKLFDNWLETIRTDRATRHILHLD